MAEYLSPGVYVEEVSTGPRPIEGVSTSTAGFVGQTERGPTIPRLVTSWQDYYRWFGGHIAPNVSYLPYAIQGFFDNNGQRAFVARVVGPGAVTASLNIPAPAGPAAPGANNVLIVRAIGPGLWGNNILVEVDNARQRNDWFRITIIYYRDRIPAPFVDPTETANLSNRDRREPDAIEDYDNLSANPNASNYVLRVVNTTSRLVQLEWDNTTPPNPPQPDPQGVPARPTNRPFGIPAAVDLATANANTQLHVEAAPLGEVGNDISVEVANGTVAGTFLLRVLQGGQEAEVFDNLVVAAANARYVLTVVNTSSRLIRVRWTPVNAANPFPPARPNDTAAPTALAGGDIIPLMAGGDEPNPATPTEYIGNPTANNNRGIGLGGLEIIDEVSILCVPDEANDTLDPADVLTNAVIDQCERTRDRFAVLSVPAGQGDVGPIQPPRDTTYGAVYYPPIRVVDPRNQDTLLIPPAGHVAGIYARTDVERGVHKAPANEVVRGIVTRDINSNRGPLEFKISKEQHDILNPRGVNVIRDFRADRRGIRVWGARTMSSDALWRYVNVRRLFLFVEESIDEGTQWVVFEPNYEQTWAAVRRSITTFLDRVWRSGALVGATQQEAFFVKCDRTTMTQDDIDNGRLICLIGIAPVKPAEFVIFRISQKTAEATA
jgi:phage tail sheath protein FI